MKTELKALPAGRCIMLEYKTGSRMEEIWCGPMLIYWMMQQLLCFFKIYNKPCFVNILSCLIHKARLPSASHWDARGITENRNAHWNHRLQQQHLNPPSEHFWCPPVTLWSPHCQLQQSCSSYLSAFVNSSTAIICFLTGGTSSVHVVLAAGPGSAAGALWFLIKTKNVKNAVLANPLQQTVGGN